MADPCRLYLITPPRLPADFAHTLAQTLDAGDVGCLQLRLDDSDAEIVRAAIDTLRPVAQAADVAFLLNGDPQLAAQTGCDGVHISQQDGACDQAREILGAEAIIGVSCRASRHLAIDAANGGADYVCFGPFHKSTTKQVDDLADPDILTLWHEATTVPCVAIGGITVENCAALVRTGVDFIAGVAGVWDYPQGPAQAIKDFNAAIASAKAS